MTESRLVSDEEKFFGVSGSSCYLLSCVAVAAVIVSEDRQCWSVRGRQQERGISFQLAVCSLCGRLPKKARKNSSLEEDGINAPCPLIGQCVAGSLGGALIREKK